MAATLFIMNIISSLDMSLIQSYLGNTLLSDLSK